MGADEAADEVMASAWPQLALILQSGEYALGLADPKLVSRFLAYEPPAAPGPHEAAYAGVITKEGGYLSGHMGDTPGATDILKDNFEQAAKEAAIEAAVHAALGNVPGAGIVVEVVKVATGKTDFSSQAGRVSAGFAVASAIPVVNIVAIPVALGSMLSSVLKAGDKMEAEKERAEEFTKMIQSFIDVVLPEAQGLALTLAERGYPFGSEASPSWNSQLKSHYKALVLEPKRDHNLKGLQLLKNSVLTFFSGKVPEWDSLPVDAKVGISARFQGTVAQAKARLARKKQNQDPELRKAVEQARLKSRDYFVSAVEAVELNPTSFESTIKNFLELAQKFVPHVITKDKSQVPDIFNAFGISQIAVLNAKKKPNTLVYEYSWQDVSVGRTDRLRYLLQFARDMRKVRETIETGISPMGTPFKTAAKLSQEVASITNEVVQANPNVPYQVAAGAASTIVQQTPSLTSREQSVVAGKIVESAVRNDSALAVKSPEPLSATLMSRASAGAVQLVEQGIPQDIAVKSAAYQVKSASGFYKWLLPVGAAAVLVAVFMVRRRKRQGLTTPQNKLGLIRNPRRRTKRG